jgi:hypothetical protein
MSSAISPYRFSWGTGFLKGGCYMTHPFVLWIQYTVGVGKQAYRYTVGQGH